MMKKSFFGALLLFALAACSPRTETVVILSTNDIHSHIEKFPQLAEAVKECRDTARNVILVDAGDRWTGNVYSDRAAEPRKPIIDLMNKLRYDVATYSAATNSIIVSDTRVSVYRAVQFSGDLRQHPQRYGDFPPAGALCRRRARRTQDLLRGRRDQLRPQQPSCGA